MTYQDAIEDSDIIDGLNLKYLKFFGLWKVINDYRTTGKRNGILKVTVLMTICLVSPYGIFQCMSYFYIKVDLQKATFLNLNLMSAVQLICRMIVFWFTIGSQCRLMNLMKKDFLDIPEHKRKAVGEMFKKVCRTSNACCHTVFIFNAITIISFIWNPDTSVDYILYHTGSMDSVTTGRKKIFGGWYPCPMDQFPYYEIIFVYESIGLTWAAILLAVYFCAFYQVIISLYAQFTALGFHISTMKFDVDSTKALPKDETLKRIIKDHQNLLRYTEELKNVYNPLVTMTLGVGIGTLVIGTVQFLMAKASPVFIIKLLQVFMIQGLEVCLFCFGSSFIETASEDLQFATYSSEWYKASKTVANDAQMLMISAQKGVRLTAIRMHPVNRGTLMTILQFTYSTATVFSGMSE